MHQPLPLPYFAYGSNMDPVQMRVRCPGARITGTAILPGYRWIINSAGYATVIPSPAHTVYGVLWELTQEHLVTLDEYEGLQEDIYWRTDVTIQSLTEKKPVRAIIYFARSEIEGRPVPDYTEHILRTARDFVFPESYIRELAKFG
ncbi:MAG TPA: gamma-glutamylcyclotransferase family protein [Verrucomicrobiae bacterium]